jgi:23S rRNA (cytidine1920-2'-O)/16S rRNA (cytidine1409-2'-O)-methyltransferase
VKERLDKLLVDRGLAATRSQAKSLIEKGDVTVAGKVLRKAGELVTPETEISVTAPLYVGRGAFKLEGALEEFKVAVAGKVLLDIGASTGGFTEVLLKHGATKVYAVDVGHGQLAPKLREDPRVINLEGTNVRELTSLPEVVAGAVMDLSFISITKVLDQVRSLLAPGGFLLVLVKPQFEAGIERLPKDGVVKDQGVRQEILREVQEFAEGHGWTHRGTMLSPIEGKAGNVEFFSYYLRD